MKGRCVETAPTAVRANAKTYWSAYLLSVQTTHERCFNAHMNSDRKWRTCSQARVCFVLFLLHCNYFVFPCVNAIYIWFVYKNWIKPLAQAQAQQIWGRGCCNFIHSLRFFTRLTDRSPCMSKKISYMWSKNMFLV